LGVKGKNRKPRGKKREEGGEGGDGKGAPVLQSAEKRRDQALKKSKHLPYQHRRKKKERRR